jgi:hypothetical protein
MSVQYALLGVMAIWLLHPRSGDVPKNGAVEAPRGTTTSVTATEPSVQSAVALLRSGTVARFDILYLPREVETPIRVTPEALDSICFFRIGVSEQAQDSRLRNELIAALESSGIVRATGPYAEPDCRWGCVFYDADGTPILSMYFDDFGVKGLIDGTPVTGVGPVVRLLERRCSCLWE